jgi:ABC-type multidrug transport system fused ATPase/permease subunit
MAQVKLNKDSWHFKYYSLIVSDNPPKSLCPYFWTMVPLILLSPLVGLIMSIFYIMKYITMFFDWIVPKKEKKQKSMKEYQREYKKIIETQREKEKRREKFWNSVGDKFSWCFTYIFVPLGIIILIYTVFSTAVKVGWLKFLIYLGLAILTLGLIVGFIIFVETFGGRIGKFISKCLSILNPFNWKVTKICGEMIVATYTKMCPIITWEGKEENE